MILAASFWMRRAAGAMTFAQIAMLLSTGLALTAALALSVRALRRRVSFRRELRPHYARLGGFAPGDPCPCGRATPAPPYGECCRARDVAKLEEDVHSFIVQQWSHRSYAGRRSSRSLGGRLEEFPLPTVVLPVWVRRPERFSFPIDERLLRKWSPLRPGAHPRREDADAGHLPF